MNLVLLPHHNTITSLQQLQKSVSESTTPQADGRIFLPSYPLVCVLSKDGDKKRIKVFKDMMKGAQGTLHFILPEFQKTGNDKYPGISGTLVLPVQVPFMNLVKEAGFTPVTEPHIILGNLYGAEAGHTDKTGTACMPLSGAKLPPASRAFRLALMQTAPLSGGTALSEPATCSCSSMLSEAGTAAAFSWKFTDAFWVKLG